MQIKFFKIKKSFKKHGLAFKPDFYWQLIVFAVFILILASFIFGYYLFMQINQESILSVGSGGRQETVKKERLEKVLEYFSLREKKSIEILNSPAPVIDPSI